MLDWSYSVVEETIESVPKLHNRDAEEAEDDELDAVVVSCALDPLVLEEVDCPVLVVARLLSCEIQDEGPGLSAEDQKKLFGKFARLSAKPTGGEHATGLGLSIVKKMVEAMNGQVWCESELGQGARFVVQFPITA